MGAIFKAPSAPTTFVTKPAPAEPDVPDDLPDANALARASKRAKDALKRTKRSSLIIPLDTNTLPSTSGLQLS